jgi:hypothetical protein
MPVRLSAGRDDCEAFGNPLSPKHFFAMPDNSSGWNKSRKYALWVL